jgi:uncharacterized protein (TIGR03643 family)
MKDDNSTLDDIHASEIIALAWCDKTSWSAIEAQTGLKESQIMKLMKENLKPKSYTLWRKRVKKHKNQ